MASKAVSHFEKLFSQIQDEDPTSLQHVLDSQIKLISATKREYMDRPLMVAELHVVVKALSKGKVLGPDGIPLEFFPAIMGHH